MTKQTTGQIHWHDLTVDNAEEVSNFYQEVIGWSREAVSMGDYNDFNMNANDGTTIAGVCHAKGSNADIPPQWMMYVEVEDVENSIKSVSELGGSVLKGPTSFGGQAYYLIKDPAGAVITIYS